MLFYHHDNGIPATKNDSAGWGIVEPQISVLCASPKQGPLQDPVSGGRKLKRNTSLRIVQASPPGLEGTVRGHFRPWGVIALLKAQSQLEHVG